jgi:hypothetical protein
MAPEIRLHQRIGYQARILVRHALPGVNSGCEIDQALGIHTRNAGHEMFSIAKRRMNVEFLMLRGLRL